MPISPIWPAATAVNAEGSIEFHGRTAESLLDEFGSPLYLIDTDEVVARARHFVRAAAEAFNTSTTHVSFAGKAFLSKEVVRLVTEAGMSDNIRPALYGADYTARLANRTGSAETMLARVCGMHCESGDIVVHEVQLPADLKRGDILAVPVTGAYGRTMASNYNQALIPAVVAVSESGAHVMLRRQTVDDLLNLDVSE